VCWCRWQILEGELQKLGEKGLVKTYKKRNFRLRSDGFLRYFDGVKETGYVAALLSCWRVPSLCVSCSRRLLVVPHCCVVCQLEALCCCSIG